MWTYALSMLARPRRTIQAILQARLTIGTVLVFLFWVGCLRGILEVIWILALNDRLGDGLRLAGYWPWWVLESGPFILANILTAYFRWALYGTVFVLVLRLFGIRPAFAEVLRVFGAMLGLYVLTILVNFVHGVTDLKMLHVYVADHYVPAFGLGQALSTGLMVWMVIAYGRLAGLDGPSALLGALLLVLVERGMNLAAAWWYFRLPFVGTLSARTVVLVANHLTTVASLVGTVMLLWVGSRLHAKRTAHP